MEQAPKQLRRLVREWAGIAHDRELSLALFELRKHFDRWQQGEITATELNDLIHKYHEGPAREAWKHYATNRLEPAIGFCIAPAFFDATRCPP